MLIVVYLLYSICSLLYSICSLLYSNCTTATGINPNRSQINMYVCLYLKPSFEKMLSFIAGLLSIACRPQSDTKIGTKIRRKVAVAQSVYFVCELKATELWLLPGLPSFQCWGLGRVKNFLLSVSSSPILEHDGSPIQ
jgi:hypothetical protein